MSDALIGRVDGVHNLNGPYDLPLLVWRTARVKDLVALGVPRHEVTETRFKCTGSEKPAKLSRMLLATGMWSVNSPGEIAHATGIAVERIRELARHPFYKGELVATERHTQARLAGLISWSGGTAVRAGGEFHTQPLDAHLLRRRMRWLQQRLGLDGNQVAFVISNAELDAMWSEHGLTLRVGSTDLSHARRLIGRANGRGPFRI